MASRPKCFLQSLFVVIVSISQVLASSCSSTFKSVSDCWYTLWYFWFVLILFVVGVTILLMFYFKIRTKNRVTNFIGAGNPNIVSMPRPPPSYIASYPPPSYEATITNQLPPPVYLPVPSGYMTEMHTMPNNNHDETQFPSTLSIDALSSPPPYSERQSR
ncbi:uncharacterized protein LOC121382015 [Gigantopelta aegis]|uniref:uncharacterized protein LOC121382015 n=1 Tax=Gigantopelta aegis TaxID=1735272 RepID=UPI001B88A14D|nr:uncharacterized protein LOC121382015 [Gigantopelta aegis]